MLLSLHAQEPFVAETKLFVRKEKKEDQKQFLFLESKNFSATNVARARKPGNIQFPSDRVCARRKKYVRRKKLWQQKQTKQELPVKKYLNN